MGAEEEEAEPAARSIVRESVRRHRATAGPPMATTKRLEAENLEDIRFPTRRGN